MRRNFLAIVITVLLASIFGLGCAQVGIERGERIAIVIKADKELEELAKEVEEVIKEGAEVFGCPVLIMEFIPPDSLEVAGTQPKPALFKRIPKDTDKLLVARLTGRKQEPDLSWRTISMKTGECISRGSRSVPVQDKEKFYEFLYGLVRDVIDIKEMKED